MNENEALIEKFTREEIILFALESEEPMIKELVLQILTLTKLLHPEEVKRNVDHILILYGLKEGISLC